jgi:hypothetical protein
MLAALDTLFAGATFASLSHHRLVQGHCVEAEYIVGLAAFARRAASQDIKIGHTALLHATR